MTPASIRQAQFRARRQAKIEAMKQALTAIAAELSDSKTDKGKRLHTLAIEALGESK